MALYTIADLHLPLGIDKPMDIFGKAWENYVERLADNWQSVVKENDVVVLPGDFPRHDISFLSFCGVVRHVGRGDQGRH